MLRSTDINDVHDAEITQIISRKKTLDIQMITDRGFEKKWRFVGVENYCFSGSLRQAVIDNVEIYSFTEDYDSIYDNVLKYRDYLGIPFDRNDTLFAIKNKLQAFVFIGTTSFFLDVIASDCEIVV